MAIVDATGQQPPPSPRWQLVKRLIKGHARAFKAAALPKYVPPPPTEEKLEWADLAIIDFSKASTAEGRQSLAKDVKQAMNTHGFFYIVNHGYTPEQAKKMFNIASATFELVDEGEKKKYTGQSETVYEGYKPRQTWQLEPGVADQIEHYNINRLVRSRDHPVVLWPHLDEIQNFARHNHVHVLFNVLRLLAIGMELPEETFVEKHKFEAPGESSVRFMKYYPRSADEEKLTKNVWLKGHTDIGSITILWSQPVSGLQILSVDGEWRNVKHLENALVVNTGDVMQLLSGGFYKPTIHRVVQPPKDQAQLARLGVFYFAMASDDVKLVSVKDSKVESEAAANAPIMREWRQERTGKYGKGTMKPSLNEEKVDEEVVLGVVVKEYN